MLKLFTMETINKSPVHLTESALTEIHRLLAEDSFDTAKKLRFGVKGGGCSGLSYLLDFDLQKPGDIEFECEGIQCIIEPAHEIYLQGMEIDWQDGLNSRGFTFKNPNASTTCGCGSSFAV